MVGGACASLTTLPGHHGDEGGPQLPLRKEQSFIRCFHIEPERYEAKSNKQQFI